MPRRAPEEDKLYEAGDWWIGRRKGTANLQRCTYNPATGRVDRFTLGTRDLGVAKAKLLKFLAEEHEAPPPPQAEVSLAYVLRHYFLKVRKGGLSETQAKAELRFWTAFWKDALVADITSTRIDNFIDWLRQQKTRPGYKVKNHVPKPLSDGYISKVLASGRAALRLADKENLIGKAPFVRDVETADDKRNKEPKGRPISTEEAARLFDAAAAGPEHLWRFLVTLTCTLSRPNAVLDLDATMCRRDAGYCNLLPPGRKQTKKRRGIVPICKTFDAWLAQWPAAGPIVDAARAMKAEDGETVKGAPKSIKSIVTAWKLMRARAFPPRAEQLAALPPIESFPAGEERWAEARRRAMICAPEGEGVTPYSFRHTLPRHMRRSGVPGDQISIYLSHIVVSENDTTLIYSPHAPDFCRKAAKVLDAWCAEVSSLQTSYKRLVPKHGRVSVAGVVTSSEEVVSRQSSRQPRGRVNGKR